MSDLLNKNTLTQLIRHYQGIFSTLLNYDYSSYHHLIKETYFKNIYNPGSTFSTITQARNPIDHEINRILWATDLDLNPKNRIGVQYLFQHNQLDTYSGRDLTILDNTIQTNKKVDQYNHSRRNLHSFTLNYNLEISDNSSLTVITDYATNSRKGNNRTTEENLGTQTYTDVAIDNRSTYDIFTASLNYKFQLFSDYNIQIGGQYVDVGNPSHVKTAYETLPPLLEYTRLNDQVQAGYFNINKTWNTLNIQAGLRYEGAKTHIRSEQADSTETVNRTYTDFFPSLKINWKLSETVRLTLNASRNISRPGFRELVPALVYEDSLSYISGNPFVKPAYYQVASVGAEWKNLSFTVQYTDVKDKIQQTYVNDPLHPGITQMIPVNLSRSSAFDVNAMYTFNYRKISSFASAGIHIPNEIIPYLNEEVKVRKASWNVSLNAEYSLSNIFTIHGDFFYNSSRYAMITHQKSTNGLNLGIRGQFLKKRLMVDLYGTDLLYGSNFNNVTNTYLNIQSGTTGKGDFRGVRLQVSYVLFSSDKANIRSRRGNNNVLDRIN